MRLSNCLAGPRMMYRIEFDDTASEAALPVAGMPDAPCASARVQHRPADPTGDSRNDLAMVEDLLDRCWREVDAAALNVKLADIVRLLEFKTKLRSAADAERTFWTMIHDMRREELARFGVVDPATDQPDTTDPPESESPDPDP